MWHFMCEKMSKSAHFEGLFKRRTCRDNKDGEKVESFLYICRHIMAIMLGKGLNKRKLGFGKKDKQVFVNMFNLLMLQGINYLYPIITLPYLYRMLGVGNMGVVAIAQSMMQFFITFVDYGFDLTATKAISRNRDNKEEVARIFHYVMTTKFLLCLVGFLIMCAIVFSVPLFREHATVFIIMYGFAFGQFLFPMWLFMGFEKMKYIAYINSMIKIAGIFSIFLAINHAEHFYRFVVINASIPFVAGMVGLLVAMYKYKLGFHLPKVLEITEAIKEGWHVFVGSLSTVVYMIANTITLGFFAGIEVVGYYSIVEKIIFAIRGGAVVIFKAIYPNVCNLAVSGFTYVKDYFIKLFSFFSLGFLFFSVLAFIFSDYITTLLIGYPNELASLLLKIMAIVPLIVLLNIPAYQTLIVYNMQRKYSKVLLVGALLSITLNIVLAYYFQAVGIAVSVVLVEVMVTSALYLSVRANRHKM